LHGEDGEGDSRPSALDALGMAENALSRLVRVDESAAGLVEQLSEGLAILDDLSRDLNRYREAIEFNPHRLAEVEDRLHLIRNLQRKYGSTVAEVMEFGDRARAELSRIASASERIDDLVGAETRLRSETGARGAALSVARRAARMRSAWSRSIVPSRPTLPRR
jgi:DNA repair protein RecN (Recombination protein N)